MGLPAIDWGVSSQERREMREAVELERRDAEQRLLDMRSSERVTMAVAVTGVCDNNFFMGFSENISEGGVFLSTMCPPRVGEVIDLSLAVGEDHALLVKGEVRWHRTDDSGEPTGCGIKFYPLTPEQEALVAKAIEATGKHPLFYDE